MNENEGPSSVLQGRYQLLQKQLSKDAVSESWLGYDEDQSRYLIKLWRYHDEKPSDPARALWNSELRLLYRLCSSPKAEESILLMRDAGIDRDARAFVMVLESTGQGYENLAGALANRSNYPWLTLTSLKNQLDRKKLWQGLGRLADGIRLLHVQHVIHRNISAETVYFDSAQGPNSWRLGGFEWSLRLGNATSGAPVNVWGTPPEWFSEQAIGYTFETDWYAFGMLVARCFYSIEGWSNRTPEELNGLVYGEVSQKSGPNLSEVERHLIQRLIAPRRTDRLTFAEDIIKEIDEIQNGLATGAIYDKNDKPLILAIDKKNEKLVAAAREVGFQPNPTNPSQEYSQQNPGHVAALKKFIRKDLEEARLYPLKDSVSYLLVGLRLNWLIDQFKE